MIKIIFKNFGLNCSYVFLINVVCKNNDFGFWICIYVDIFVYIRFRDYGLFFEECWFFGGKSCDVVWCFVFL